MGLCAGGPIHLLGPSNPDGPCFSRADARHRLTRYRANGSRARHVCRVQAPPYLGASAHGFSSRVPAGVTDGLHVAAQGVPRAVVRSRFISKRSRPACLGPWLECLGIVDPMCPWRGDKTTTAWTDDHSLLLDRSAGKWRSWSRSPGMDARRVRGARCGRRSGEESLGPPGDHQGPVRRRSAPRSAIRHRSPAGGGHDAGPTRRAECCDGFPRKPRLYGTAATCGAKRGPMDSGSLWTSDSQDRGASEWHRPR